MFDLIDLGTIDLADFILRSQKKIMFYLFTYLLAQAMEQSTS